MLFGLVAGHAARRRPLKSHYRVLLVDDDPQLLASLALNLRRRFDVECAQSGPDALEALRKSSNTVVIISDMRMPGMNGAQFLRESRTIAADARRILLTGYSDVTSAMEAVNKGQICRFLTKPCALEELTEAINFAIADYESELSTRNAIRLATERLACQQDPATGLARREHLLEVLEQRVAEHQLTQEPPGALFLLEFRVSLGGAEEVDVFAVDVLVRALAARVRAKLPAATCLCRWDAQKIMIYDATCIQPGAALQCGFELADLALQPLVIEGTEQSVEANVGVVVIPSSCLEPRAVLRHAELAAQEAAQQGRNTACLFSTESGAAYEYRRELVRSLRAAIAQETLDLHYQPIIDFRTGGTIFAVEALARWKDPMLGHIPPGTFIPLAESTGLVVPLGEWTLRRACRDVRLIIDERCARVSINASLPQLLDIGFLNAVYAALDDAKIDPACLMIEVTESVFAANMERVCEILQTLRRMGTLVAIDDFGAGYSSLSYLSRLPVDVLKIDSAFMQDFSHHGAAIIASTLELAQKLGIHAIVEGVENAEMLNQAFSVGASVMQGYYFARPMPAVDVRPWMDQPLGGQTSECAVVEKKA